MSAASTGILVLALFAATACSEADCVTDGCGMLPHDGGVDAPFDGGFDASLDGGLDAGPRCVIWQPIGCDPGSCPDPSSVSLGLERVASVKSVEAPALESVDFIHGSEGRAIAMSAEHLLAEVFYGTDLRIGRIRTLPVGASLQYTSSVAVHPSGSFAAVSLADADCATGEVVLVDVTEEGFGRELERIEVGYVPDNLHFSLDGAWLVTADEDNRSNRPCKPVDRWGGSVTFVDVSGGAATATAVRTVNVAHATDSEPESVAIGSAGTVAVTLQDTNELLILSVDDAVEPRLIALPASSGPEGVAVDDERGIAVVGLESGDEIITVDIETGAVLFRVDLVASGHVPPGYNRDPGEEDVHEPEQIVLVDHFGAKIAVVPLQESHAAIAYRVEDDGALVFDSIAPVGVDYLLEEGGLGRSRIGPEGIAARADIGLFLVAAEREGSLTLLRSTASMYAECP